VSALPQSHVPQPAPAGPQILIVDDNAMVTKALAGLIRGAGFGAVACQSGSEALSYAQNSTPAAAVIDIHMPDMNGLVLAQKLRDRFGPQIPIIIVSGDTSMETLRSLSHVGATYFFSKPLSATLLIQRLRELLEPSSQTRA
jgi:CheY-like chemotaxis protein